ncbi:uncharacterized protein TNCT_645891 [Trichonephila clavata]|uniref:Uncharacterized protein n=1 Tax=Trichonephila clavata TaxID=2740835 RepID=A0A8X6L291_TRICU|nr:uncharacterized protein TNCT_645891 [Trichonephila clavata]
MKFYQNNSGITSFVVVKINVKRFSAVLLASFDMANSKDYKDVGLNNDKNQNVSGSSPSSDFDRLEDCNEAEFRGATLSLSQETSPPESIAASACGVLLVINFKA